MPCCVLALPGPRIEVDILEQPNKQNALIAIASNARLGAELRDLVGFTSWDVPGVSSPSLGYKERGSLNRKPKTLAGGKL